MRQGTGWRGSSLPRVILSDGARIVIGIYTSMDNACKTDTDITSDDKIVEVLVVKKVEKVRIWLLIVYLKPPSIIVTSETGN